MTVNLTNSVVIWFSRLRPLLFSTHLTVDTLNQKQRIIEENEQLLALWQQVKAGDKEAFCQLANAQYRNLFNYATNFTSDREFIKDAIQDVLIHVWAKRQTITIQFVTIYLLKSLRNQLLQELRQVKPLIVNQEISLLTQVSDYQTIETRLEKEEADSESKQRLRQAIHTLPGRQQEVVFLKFYEGLENEQTADLMQINRQSVANLLYKALLALKSQIPSLN